MAIWGVHEGGTFGSILLDWGWKVTKWQKFDSGGKFHLSKNPGGGYSTSMDGSLGSGASFSTYRFESEEGREYFIQAEQLGEKLNLAMLENKYYALTIMELRTLKGAWKNLRKAIKQVIQW